MKILIHFFLLIFIGASSCKSQQKIAATTCTNATILQQAENIKLQSFAEGFILLKEAYMSMESQYEQPVILPLNADALYQIVFIGDPLAKMIEVRMYDWKEKQVKYEKKGRGDFNGHVIQYFYTPKFTEYHIIKPVQVNKRKKLCGYMMLLKKVK